MAAGDGLVSMTPSSIAHSGTSASINADGGVDFTAVTELSLNGVFTSDYDNYLIVMTETLTNTGNDTYLILRAAGSDAIGSDYTSQWMLANNTSVTGARRTSQTNYFLGGGSATRPNGCHIAVYGPALAQPTAFRLVVVNPQGTSDQPVIYDTAGTHSLSTAYDGFTLTRSSGDLGGTVHVFGYEE